MLKLSKVLHNVNSHILRSRKTITTPIYRFVSTPSIGLNMVADNKVNVSHTLGAKEKLAGETLAAKTTVPVFALFSCCSLSTSSLHYCYHS